MELWTYLKTANKPIVLYGTGNGADKTVARLATDGVKLSGVFSSDGFKKNKVYAGFSVTDYTTLKASLGEMIILVCFGSHLPQVMDNVKELARENELYLPDVPVFGDVIFDIDFVHRYRMQLEKVYALLADDISKITFENILRFKLSGKLEFLIKAESCRQDVFSLINLGADESFLDLGAFTGDTVEEFLNNTVGYRYITAVEPDKRNFRKLTQNTNEIKNIHCINAAVSDKVGEIFITANHGRGNSGAGKLIKVDSVTVDSISQNTPPTFIKMDVEGNELNAIKGMVETLSEFKPKLHIACYHTPYDLFEIPLKILEINPEYKLYMRHHPCFPAWDVNYIFV